MNGRAALEEERFVEQEPPSGIRDHLGLDTTWSSLPPTPKPRDDWWPMWVAETVERVSLGDGRELVFHEAVGCRRQRREEEFLVEIRPLGVEGAGSTFSAARQDAAKKVWDEADRMLHTPSHTLDGEALERKGLLLGHVDVVRSGISRSLGEFTWVLGQVEREQEGKPYFRAAGTSGERFEFATELEKDVPTDEFLRMGKVRADVIGLAVGPVVALGDPLDDDPERTWAEWQRLLDEHE